MENCADCSSPEKGKPLTNTELPANIVDGTIAEITRHCILKFINSKIGASFLTQGGFRTNHCCNGMIIVFHEAATKYKSNLHTAFLDIHAAYDSVDRRILWRRCRNRGLSLGCVDLLKELFDHNSGQIFVGGKRSQPFHIESGVLQGSVLRPCLYSIFIDELARELSTTSTVKIGPALYTVRGRHCTVF